MIRFGVGFVFGRLLPPLSLSVHDLLLHIVCSVALLFVVCLPVKRSNEMVFKFTHTHTHTDSDTDSTTQKKTENQKYDA